MSIFLNDLYNFHNFEETPMKLKRLSFQVIKSPKFQLKLNRSINFKMAGINNF